MTDVPRWTGREATRLRNALRHSIEEFAHHLGVSARTVARWHQEPGTEPRPAVQQLLDRALATASEAVRQRFSDSEKARAPAALQVALAVVLHDKQVLLVRPQTQESTTWQFPAGIVKPGASPEAIAVRETLAETGIDCTVVCRIGSRTHPITGVYCVYLLCEYLAGEPENRDPFENLNVRWVPTAEVVRFIPEDRIYPPALTLIKESM